MDSSSIEPGLESGVLVESIEFDIGSGYASSSKVPPAAVFHESKWQLYSEQLGPLQLQHSLLSRFLEKVCAPPCHSSPLPLEGWKLILPCLTRPADWELPVACWNETEKALRSPQKRESMVRGLAVLRQQCPQEVARWLRLSPHNLCRTARRLGMFNPERAQQVVGQARRHPTFSEPGEAECFERWLKQWGPLRTPDWLSEGVERGRPAEQLAREFRKQQPALQLDLLYRLLRS